MTGAAEARVVRRGRERGTTGDPGTQAKKKSSGVVRSSCVCLAAVDEDLLSPGA